jgi:hypothetical protein
MMWIYWWGYRVVMRIAHRCQWHYAPLIGPIHPTGEYQRWCHWCGFRETLPKPVDRISVGSDNAPSVINHA